MLEICVHSNIRELPDTKHKEKNTMIKRAVLEHHNPASQRCTALPAWLPLAMALTGFCMAFAQDIPTAAQSVVGMDAEQQRAIAATDIDTLIDNLANGRPTIIQTRVFSGGVILDNFAASAVARDGGEFNPTSQSIVATGTLNGTPVIEDTRLIDSDGTMYIVRDVYLNGQPTDLSLGRSTPVTLTEGNARPMVARANVATLTPQIAAIHGYTNVAGVGINDGKVDMGKCGGGYDGGRAVNNQPNTFFWTLNGSNFGTTKGTIVLAGITVPATAITQWTATTIEFYPTVPYNWGPLSTSLSLTTAAGAKTNSGISLIPAIMTRIFGQCTYFVALTRMNAGKQPSTGAYPPGAGWLQITSAYAPQLWDQLVWEWSDSSGAHQHTAIITNLSAPVRSGNVTTWTVTIGEMNAACNNLVSSRTSNFQVQNGTITKTIQTNATTLAPGWYYR
jgi:surface antigen